MSTAIVTRKAAPVASSGGVGKFGLGVATLWLSVIVLLPLAALTTEAFSVNGLQGFMTQYRRQELSMPSASPSVPPQLWH